MKKLQGVLLFINPSAGRSHKKRLAIEEHFIHQCCEHQIPYSIHVTTQKDDFPALVEEAIQKRYSHLAVCGGDGTITQVASAMVGKDLLLAIIPGGTTNVLAKELNIPIDWRAGIDGLFKENEVRQIDAMKVGDQHFFTHVSLGVYSKVAKVTDPEIKKKYGRFAHFFTAWKMMRPDQRWSFDILLDGKKFTTQASSLIIANTGKVGARSLKWAPSSRIDDGVVNLCVIKVGRKWEYFTLLWKIFRKKYDRMEKEMEILTSTQNIVIKNPHHIPIRGNGEIICHGDLNLEVLKQVVSVIV